MSLHLSMCNCNIAYVRFFINFTVPETIKPSASSMTTMRLQITTAIPPHELEEILKKSGAGVSITVKDAEPFHGMPRWNVTVEGTEDEVERFMETLRLARAGG